MDRLAAMRAFVAVVDEGGFTAAAAKLRTSKSAVSVFVRELEAVLGTALLTRTTRRMRLTEAGERFKARAEQILNDVEEAEREASALTQRPSGLLRVSAGVSFGMRYLGCAIASFSGRYPGVEIELTLVDRFVDLVEEGVDVAIRVGQLADSSLIARRLSYTHQIVTAAPAYLQAHGTPARPQDLSTHNCLDYRLMAASGRWRLRIGRDIVDIPVQGSLHSNNGDLLREAAVSGIGLCYAPTFIVHEDLRAGRLIPLLTECRPPPLDIHAVFPASRFISAKVRAFVDHMTGYFTNPPAWEAGLGLTVP